MSEYTPGPWKWGDGWNASEREKYMDFQLYGAGDVEIIPIRVDHHEPIWDVDLFHSYLGGGITPKADRDLIAAAPDLLAALEAMCVRYREETTNKFFQAPPWLVEAENTLAKAKGE